MSVIAQLRYFLSRRQRWQAVCLLGGMAFGAIAEAVGVGAIFPLILLLQDPAAALQKPLFAKAHLLLGAPAPREFLIWIGGAVLLIYLLKNCLLTLLYHWQFRFVYGLQVNVASRLFTGYLFSPYPFHLQRNSAELLKNITNEVQSAFHNFMVPGLLLLSELLVAGIIIAVLVAVNPIAATTAAVAGGLLTFGFFRMVRAKTRRRGELQQMHNEGMMKWVNQALGSIKETKVLGCESYFVDRFSADAVGFARTLRHLQFVSVVPRLALETIAFVGMILILLVAVFRSPNPQAVAPLLALFAMAAFRLLPSINRITSMLTLVRFFRPAMEVVYRDLSQLESARVDHTRALVRQRPSRRLSFTRDIVLQNITYRYVGADRPAVRGVSLTIPRGSAVALVGPTGSGKTTLVDLLLGLFEPAEGTLLVDGIPILPDHVAEWQQNIGYIPQTIYLMDDSIRRNVAFGVPDAVIDEARLWQALRSAQLETFVRRAPEQLETKVGERGVRLSGGERQRIGIARALYANPDVLVMDEATSALDTGTEQEVIQAINRLRGEKTLVVIAHRLTTVKNCDAIYQMQNGELIAPVAYEQLIQVTV